MTTLLTYAAQVLTGRHFNVTQRTNLEIQKSPTTKRSRHPLELKAL